CNRPSTHYKPNSYANGYDKPSEDQSADCYAANPRTPYLSGFGCVWFGGRDGSIVAPPAAPAGTPCPMT
ncbi:hypothetical protein ABZ671_32695, partial [Micromonospora sp. NPDC006766]|uniref:hypothetical protein n=1 Tax=Micromonospora sp. NPDC006766 TaxID=3154778 RepID=UPI00340D1934